MAGKNGNGNDLTILSTQTAEPFEKQLWKAADKLRKRIDAAELKLSGFRTNIPEMHLRCFCRIAGQV